MNALEAVRNDALFALRLLRKSPTFTIAAVVTLALGMGVSTTVFSVVNTLILRPLPVPNSDRLVVIATERSVDGTLGGVSFPDLDDYRSGGSSVFEEVAGYMVGFAGLMPEGGRPERVLVTWVTGSYFPLLGIQPALGRLFRSDEGSPGAIDRHVVLGYSTWQRVFSGDPSAIGRTIRINGLPCTIVGVVPPNFVGTFAFSEAAVYLPLNWSGEYDFARRQDRDLHALARRRSEATLETAQASMMVVAQQLALQYPKSNEAQRIRVLPERFARPQEDQARSNARVSAIVLMLSWGVLMIAAVNVVNLLLARATARRREFAIRAALGAGHGRLIRQLITESVVLATLGGLGGVLLGMWAGRVFATMRPPGDLPVRFDFGLDGRVLVYAVITMLATGVLVGLVPSLWARRLDLERALRQSPVESTARRNGLGDALVAAQLALCFLLLVVAGLFGRSLVQAQRSDFGFRPEGVLNMHVDVAQVGYTESRGRTLFTDIERRVRAVPGVQALSFAFSVPMGYVRLRDGLEAEGELIDVDRHPLAGKNIVSPEYFATMGIPIVEGRAFTHDDHDKSRRVAIVNTQLAKMLWPNRNPIGRRFKRAGSTAAWYEVVGVTNTGKYRYLFEPPQPYYYVAMAQHYTAMAVLQVRTQGSPEALAPAIEQAIGELEPSLPLYGTESMSRALRSGYGLLLLQASAFSVGVFGLLGLVLALIGVYGVMAYLTSQRAHEVGVRIAVGATPSDVLRLFLRRAVMLVLVGVVGGLVVTLASSRFLASLLFGISPFDPTTFVGVASMLAVVALIACAIPAWRAAHVDATLTLRGE